MAYATASQLREVLPDAASTDDTALGNILDRATAQIEAYCSGTSFAVAGAASDRVYYGDNTYLLAIDYTEDALTTSDLSMPSGFTVPSFVVRRDTVLGTVHLNTVSPDGIRYDEFTGGYGFSGLYWPKNVPITINAAWGYTAVPSDIVDACLKLAMIEWRQTYRAALPDYRVDGDPTWDDVKRILDPRRTAGLWVGVV